MRLTITRADLIAALKITNRAAKSKASMPILSTVAIHAGENGCVMESTCLDYSIRLHAEAVTHEAGAVALPAKQLFAFAQSASGHSITIESLGINRVTVTCGASSFVIFGFPPDQFPSQINIAGESFTVSRAALAKAIKHVDHAQSTDENRYILNGVYFHGSAGKINLAACDGRCIAESGCKVSATEKPLAFIMPRNQLREVTRLLGKSGVVKINPGVSRIKFAFTEVAGAPGVSNVELQSKLVQGNYPNYKTVIPTEMPHAAGVDCAVLLSALVRVSVSSDNNPSIHAKFAPGILTLSCKSAKLGESSESLAIEYAGPEITTAFNPAYIIPAAKAIGEDWLTLKIKDESTVLVFEGSAGQVAAFMPQRLY